MSNKQFKKILKELGEIAEKDYRGKPTHEDQEAIYEKIKQLEFYAFRVLFCEEEE